MNLGIRNATHLEVQPMFDNSRLLRTQRSWFDITRITATVHRYSLGLIAVAMMISTGITAYGPGFGLSSAQIAFVAAAAVLVSTIGRMIADVANRDFSNLKAGSVSVQERYWDLERKYYALRAETEERTIGAVVAKDAGVSVPTDTQPIIGRSFV